MKKLVLLASLCSLSASTYAQTDSLTLSQRIAMLEERQMLAGKELKTFHKQYYRGIGIGLAGVAVGTIGPFIAGDFRSVDPVPFYVIGGSAVLAGSIISMLSHNRIKLAGMYLTGNGVSIGLKKEK